MAGDVNRVHLIGRLGHDVSMRYLPSGDPVASFSLATSEKWTKDGEKHEATQWHQIVVFGKLAEICGQYLAKGSLVYVEGQITYRKFTGKDGVERNVTEIKARDMRMLGPGKQQAVEPRDVPQAGSDEDDDAPPF